MAFLSQLYALNNGRNIFIQVLIHTVYAHHCHTLSGYGIIPLAQTGGCFSS